MMNSASTLFLLLAVANARFGQENLPIQAIADVQGGEPGAAPTIAGAAISDLLAGSNACAKLQRADQILAELGTGADAVAAALGMVAAEKNVNPFVQQQPAICNDPTLPANQLLRGVTPLVDPAFTNAAVANALSAATVAAPLDATGKSVADLLIENGFTDFLTQGVDGTMAAAGGTAGVAAGAAAVDTGAATAAVTAIGAVDTATATGAAGAAANDQCAASVAAAIASASAGAAAAAATNAVAAGNASTVDAAAANSTAVADAGAANAPAAVDTGAGAGAGAAEAAAGTTGAGAGGADFGTCNPTIKFEGGLGGRPATEFTFQSQDPAIEAIQQEALNPNIITNRICDELTNQCGANDAAKTLCTSAQAQIQALGTRDVTTAETWNQLLGFAGAVTNPDGGAATPDQVAAGARLRLTRRRRSFRV